MKRLSDDLKDNYIVVQSWMSRSLGLKGNQLILYALIYGFSQTNNQVCTCGIEYMRGWIRGAKSTVIRTINELEAAGLIRREEGQTEDGRVIGYRAICPSKIGSDLRLNFTLEKGSKTRPIKPKKGSKTRPKKVANCNEKGSILDEKGSKTLPNNIDNINIYTDLSVSQRAGARETDGLTDEENFLDIYGKKVIAEAYAKGLSYRAAWYLDCAREHLEQAGVNVYDYPANRLLEIIEGLGRLETVKIGGAVLPAEEVLKEILTLSADKERLEEAIIRTTECGERVKNKLGYAVSTLYNYVKNY